MNQLWTTDVSLLWKDGRIRQLFPTRQMSYAEKVNSLVRLTILTTACIYLYNRDTRYVLYGIFCIALLTTVAWIGQRQKHRATKQQLSTLQPGDPLPCTHPTQNNPFANVLLTDYKYHPDRPPACDVDEVADEIEHAYAATTIRNAGDLAPTTRGINQFYTMPDSTTWQAGREAFAKAVYGSGDTCKTDQRLCGNYF